jgi:hemin uptake protein HemP
MEAQAKPPLSHSPADSSAVRPRIESEQILRGNTTIEIEHAGQRYLLRVTRENKLILTK